MKDNDWSSNDVEVGKPENNGEEDVAVNKHKNPEVEITPKLVGDDPT